MARRLGGWRNALDLAGFRPVTADDAWLRARYVEDRWSVHQVAAELGTTRHRVLQLLAAANILTRAHGIPIDVDELVCRYKSGTTATAVAEEHRISESAILKRVRAAGVIIRRPGGGRRKPSRLDDQVWLRRRYLDDDATITEIAGQVGCAQNTVRAALFRHEIPLQPRQGRRTDRRTR